MRLSRPVRIAVHPAVVSPAVVGGLRPVVLVPPDWIDWPEAHRRACLLHELAHLARYDDWAKLAQELAPRPLLLPPLGPLAALPARPRAGAPLRRGGRGPGLAIPSSTRVSCSTWPAAGPAAPRHLSFRHGWLPFLDRRTVEVRIERLLEDDMLSTLSRRPPPVPSFSAASSWPRPSSWVGSASGLRAASSRAARRSAPRKC